MILAPLTRRAHYSRTPYRYAFIHKHSQKSKIAADPLLDETGAILPPLLELLPSYDHFTLRKPPQTFIPDSLSPRAFTGAFEISITA
jgi:hypothetical protein